MKLVRLLRHPIVPLIACLMIATMLLYFTSAYKYFEQTTVEVKAQQEIKIGEVTWTKTWPWFVETYTSRIPLDFGDKIYMSLKVEAIFDIKAGEQEWAQINLNGNGDVIGLTVLHLLESKKPAH